MAVPVRLVLLGAAGALAVGARIVGNRRRQRRSQRERRDYVSSVAKEPLVHVYASTSPPAQAAEPIMPEPRWTRRTMAMFVLASLLILSTAAVEIAREQWDLAVAVLVAFALSLLAAAVRHQQRRAFIAAAAASLDAADATVVVAEAVQVKPLPDLNGTWIKVNSLSDSLEPAMRLIHMNGMVRTAARLVKGVRLQLEGGQFHFGIFSIISWFKIFEHYHLNGDVSYSMRRDFRKGKCKGTARITPKGTLVLEYSWEEPHAGTGIDEFSVDEQGYLRISCCITSHGRSEQYTQVYRRKL